MPRAAVTSVTHLLALAAAAQAEAPGRWRSIGRLTGPSPGEMLVTTENQVNVANTAVERGSRMEERSAVLAAFIADCSPGVVQALCERVRELEAGEGVQCRLCGASAEPLTCRGCILVNDARLHRAEMALRDRKLQLADERVAALEAGLREACDLARPDADSPRFRMSGSESLGPIFARIAALRELAGAP